MDLQELLLKAGAEAALVLPFTLGLVEMAKQAFPRIKPRLYPVLALVVGMALGSLFGLAVGQEWRMALTVGFLAGWGASRTFRDAKQAELGRR